MPRTGPPPRQKNRVSPLVLIENIKNMIPNIEYLIYFICREGQLTHLFFPGRVGRGYGSEWTLVVVSPALMGLKVQNLNTKTPLGARKGLAPSLKVQNLNTKTPLGARKGLAPSLNLGPEVVIHTPS